MREEAQGKCQAYEDMKDFQKRAVDFSIDDWREFLAAFAAMGIHRGRVYLSSKRLDEMTEIVGRIADFCEHFEPIDYYNFLRLLLTFEFSFSDWHELPDQVREGVCRWFVKNFEQLEPSAFFEVGVDYEFEGRSIFSQIVFPSCYELDYALNIISNNYDAIIAR